MNSFQSPEFLIPEIFQLSKQIVNDKIILNLRTNHYVLSLPISQNSLQSPSENFDFSVQNLQKSIITN